MANDQTSTSTSSLPDITDTVAVDDTITPDIFQQMLTILEDLTQHTHIFYDDYGSACNCNCNCNCTRGTL